MGHGFHNLFPAETDEVWGSLTVRGRFVRGTDTLYHEANHFKERYGMNTINCPSASSWDAYYWAKNMVIGMLHLQNRFNSQFPRKDQPSAAELVLFLRGLVFERRLLESPDRRVLRDLEKLKQLLLEWVVAGLPEEHRPTRSWIG